jgi:hypothetical protein
LVYFFRFFLNEVSSFYFFLPGTIASLATFATLILTAVLAGFLDTSPKEGTMLRFARLGAPRVSHHIVIRGIERRKIFQDNRDRKNFLERLGKILPEPKTGRFTWVFLPNHALGSPQHKGWLLAYPMEYELSTGVPRPPTKPIRKSKEYKPNLLPLFYSQLLFKSSFIFFCPLPD